MEGEKELHEEDTTGQLLQQEGRRFLLCVGRLYTSLPCPDVPSWEALPWHGFSCLSPGPLRASHPWTAFPGLFILPDCNSTGCGAGLIPSMGLPCNSGSKDVLVSLHLN